MGAAKWIVMALTHPNEFKTLVQFYIHHEQKRDITAMQEHATSGWDRKTMRRCWDFLDMTSRSFAAVIKELEGDLARVVCLFYLVLRGLDTIEDDMTIPDDVKQPILRRFHEHTVTPGWTFDGCGPNEKDRQLLVEYDVVVEELHILQPEYRAIIVDICHKMQVGMADYAHRYAIATTGSADLPKTGGLHPEKAGGLHPEKVGGLHLEKAGGLHIEKTEDYDLYCHYVAGLVGEGLCRLFTASKKEAPWLGGELELANSMGLFLQKTNIIRDFREDVDDRRFFWPREIWGKGGPVGDLGFDNVQDLCGTDTTTVDGKPSVVDRALFVQSAMILNALNHAPDVLDFLRVLKNQSVFNFCAIPQTMAIATLELCFMNPAMFQRNIKIRKAEAAELIMSSTNPREVASIFRTYARRIHAKVTPRDPSFLGVGVVCGKIEQWCEKHYPSFVSVDTTGPAFDPMDPRSLLALADQKRDQEMAQKKRVEEMRARLGRLEGVQQRGELSVLS
ncbi:isoprenoid synthase domain-containing protein [Schizophyllum amplum]|uniref:Isoprenoid synthase domain-containing protein n=1 Tax=Schizophyllum amplum TaxID=97359 RepID=A0A550BZ97_9AGAR|nr:isoprenoid synthase domain-containing protein [Auriculariopsis ampla]